MNIIFLYENVVTTFSLLNGKAPLNEFENIDDVPGVVYPNTNWYKWLTPAMGPRIHIR